MIAYPRDAQIDRLKNQVQQLKQRLSTQEQQTADLVAFRTHALTRPAAQREEITRLRAAAANTSTIHTLPTTRERTATPS